ncbi:ArsR/SmtB family transcription factor [Rhizocola hellebori]|nr:metalloregulator ArsR/SmtB family transcription factor [Rhizocola hellebori]
MVAHDNAVHGVLSCEEAATLAALCHALAHPVRLQIVSLIQAAAEGECSQTELLPYFPISQPALRKHLVVLVDAGILVCDRRGNWAWYRLQLPALYQLVQRLPGNGSYTSI